MHLLRTSPVRYLLLIISAWALVFTVTRSVLLGFHFKEAGTGIIELLKVYASGFAYDFAFLSYAALALGLYVLLCPARVWKHPLHKFSLLTLFALSVFVMLFVAVAEFIFWDEFSIRFNFIAVDYLVYSDEVLNNILESYPIYPLLAGLALLAVTLTVLFRKKISAALAAPMPNMQSRMAGIASLIALATVSAILLNQDFPRGAGENTYQHELASNGPYQFFAAFRNNELDYKQFYSTLPMAEAAKTLRAEMRAPNVEFVSKNSLDIRRAIDNPGSLSRKNIVLVTIESLSASYLGSFGDTHGLTPNLDRLSKESLSFDNFYATGTRTDRGLEAITLSIPPTPGRSVIKRIGRESGYASLGQQLKSIGYDAVFLYGGRGYFDNMNAFFSGNGYRVVDQTSVPESDIDFKNAWGMSDENLYTQAIRIADQDHHKGQPFLLQLMTTSNHRPYTYPAGRIDIPSGSGRQGAVKYTDYAIGKFLEAARKKPWFNDTIFVFVADHCAGSAGKQDLPVEKYHIPLFIYAPAIVPAAHNSQLASQIDIAPTLLGLLNLDYTSVFFGRNLLLDHNMPGRAVIGNYQHLGLFDGTNLAILSPRRNMRIHEDALGLSVERKAQKVDPLIARAIAYYEYASYAFDHRLLNWQ